MIEFLHYPDIFFHKQNFCCHYSLAKCNKENAIIRTGKFLVRKYLHFLGVQEVFYFFTLGVQVLVLYFEQLWVCK